MLTHLVFFPCFFSLTFVEWSTDRGRVDIPFAIVREFLRSDKDIHKARDRAKNRVSLLQIAFETLPDINVNSEAAPLCCFREYRIDIISFVSLDFTNLAS